MAADPDLSPIFEDQGVDAAEVARYRAALRERIETPRGQGRLPSLGRARWLRAALAAGVSAAVAAALLVGLGRPDGGESSWLEHGDLAQVRRGVASTADPARLAGSVVPALASDDPAERGNARLVRVLAGAPDDAVRAAVAGVVDDPRPEVRAFLLEWLLERADEGVVDAERVSELLDEEPDPLCRDLLGEMLELAALTGTSSPAGQRVS